MSIPDSHPRKWSLDTRHLLTDGFEKGYVASAGLIAHGRGEAYDYLLGEKTVDVALKAQRAAVAALLLANKPVISVNGNTTALCPQEIVTLAGEVKARLEVNLFYASPEREKLIYEELQAAGAGEVYGIGIKKQTVPGLDSERGKSDKAILEGDCILVMLEDGDRTEKLVDMDKTVIAIDLNPLSRTAKRAHISIVDNVVRALPNMIEIAKELKDVDQDILESILKMYDNEKVLQEMEKIIRTN